MLKIRTNMKTTNPDLSCRWCKQYQETQEHIITECTMTPDIDIDLYKAMTNHSDTLIKEATQLTQFVNLLDKPPDTDVHIRPPDTDILTRPPDTDILTRPPDTDISNRPINILINNNTPDPGRPPGRNIPNRPLDIDIHNRLTDSDRWNWPPRPNPCNHGVHETNNNNNSVKCGCSGVSSLIAWMFFTDFLSLLFIMSFVPIITTTVQLCCISPKWCFRSEVKRTWSVFKGVFKGGFRPPPPKNFHFFLKSEGKEVERKKMKRDGGGGG